MSNQIATGTSVELSIDAGQSIAVAAISGTYTQIITAGANSGTVLASNIPGSALYGPYTNATKVRLTAGIDSLIDYEVGVTPSLDYKSATPVGITVTASKTLTGADVDQVSDCNSSSAIVLTVPQDTVLGLNNNNDRRTLAAYQAGTGAVSFAAGSGVTLRGTAPTAAQYLTTGIMRVGANEWAYL